MTITVSTFVDTEELNSVINFWDQRLGELPPRTARNLRSGGTRSTIGAILSRNWSEVFEERSEQWNAKNHPDWNAWKVENSKTVRGRIAPGQPRGLVLTGKSLERLKRTTESRGYNIATTGSPPVGGGVVTIETPPKDQVPKMLKKWGSSPTPNGSSPREWNVITRNTLTELTRIMKKNAELALKE